MQLRQRAVGPAGEGNRGAGGGYDRVRPPADFRGRTRAGTRRGGGGFHAGAGPRPGAPGGYRRGAGNRCAVGRAVRLDQRDLAGNQVQGHEPRGGARTVPRRDPLRPRTRPAGPGHGGRRRAHLGQRPGQHDRHRARRRRRSHLLRRQRRHPAAGRDLRRALAAAPRVPRRGLRVPRAQRPRPGPGQYPGGDPGRGPVALGELQRDRRTRRDHRHLPVADPAAHQVRRRPLQPEERPRGLRAGRGAQPDQAFADAPGGRRERLRPCRPPAPVGHAGKPGRLQRLRSGTDQRPRLAATLHADAPPIPVPHAFREIRQRTEVPPPRPRQALRHARPAPARRLAVLLHRPPVPRRRRRRAGPRRQPRAQLRLGVPVPRQRRGLPRPGGGSPARRPTAPFAEPGQRVHPRRRRAQLPLPRRQRTYINFVHKGDYHESLLEITQ